MPDNRVLISDKMNDFVAFSDDHIQYGITRIAYTDVQTTTFYSLANYVNHIPNANTYRVAIVAGDRSITVSMRSFFRIGNRGKREIFDQLLKLTHRWIHPHIVKRMLLEVFSEHKTVTLGPLRMSHLGIEISPNKGYLPWLQISSYRFAGGWLLVNSRNERNPGKDICFGAVFAGDPNAMALPSFFQNACGIAKSVADQGQSQVIPTEAKEKKAASALDEFIFAVYGNPPPGKRANVQMAATLAFEELLMQSVEWEEVFVAACELSYGRIPYSTHDLALSAALNLFREPKYIPRLKMAQMFARLKAVQWLQEGLVVPVFVKSFEDSLYKLYKP